MLDLGLRRRILKQWHSPYQYNADELAKQTQLRLAKMWTQFITDLLYGTIRFTLSPTYFCLFGNGSRSLYVEYRWLEPEHRTFIARRLFAHRHTLFRVVKIGINNECFCDGFVYNDHITSYIWQRELLRDFVWFIAAREQGHLTVELIAALQSVLYDHHRGQRDLFLLNLHNAVQGECLLMEVPCWGLAFYDLHPDERV